MIQRLVKMTFRLDEVEAFQAMFDERKHLILGSDGCHRLELLRDRRDARVFFTLSLWESEAHLNQYRESALFEDTWKLTKSKFEEKARAWSLDSIISLDHMSQ